MGESRIAPTLLLQDFVTIKKIRLDVVVEGGFAHTEATEVTH